MCLVWQVAYATEVTISPEQLTLFDESRARPIPIMIYKPVSATTEHRPVAIISHGHTIRNSEYSFLANALVKQGYVVVSIQHDLEDDPELPTTGILVERRKPLWDRGIQNIMFVLSMLKETQPTLDLDKVILIGHSNGGDISMLFATTHPKLVAKVVSLDSLRVPFPTKNHIPLLSLRANDKKADEGVLPKSGANIIKLKNAKHIDMCDRGSDEVKQEINKFIIAFLQNS
jgi:predicted dienelactone hydrolase